MIVTGLVALALLIVMGMAVWEAHAALEDAWRELGAAEEGAEALQAIIDGQSEIIAELRQRIAQIQRQQLGDGPAGGGV